MNLGTLVRALVLAPVATGLLLTSACSVFGAESSAPPAEGAPALPPGAPAPAIGTPAEEEVNESFGVFVTENGKDDGAGTRTSPYRSIRAAIAAARPSAKRVYVCKGAYAESLELADAVSVVGGYDCSDPAAWTRAPGGRSTVSAPSSPAVRAQNVVRTTRFEGFDVTSADAHEPSASSIAFWAEGAVALVVADATMKAGRGADGSDGVAPPMPDPGPTATGSAATTGSYDYPNNGLFPYPAAPAGGTSACGGGAGGAGGRGGVWYCENNRLVPATRVLPITQQSVIIGAATGPVEAPLGPVGTVGADGASASRPGRLARAGFVPSDGATGTNGGGGAGGGGGYPSQPDRLCTNGRYTTLENGPGGGAGGCGGLAGSAGTGGGASIAAFVVDSGGLVFEATSLVAGNGGRGGEGTFGAEPTRGENGGAKGTSTSTASSGTAGGRAGVSGSGAGGSSYGLVHTGPLPALTLGSRATAAIAGEGTPVRTTVVRVNAQAASIGASSAGVAKDVEAF